MQVVYIVIWQTEGHQDLEVFSSLKVANKYFDSRLSRFGLTETKMTYYVRQAFGRGAARTASGDGSLTLMKKEVYSNYIIIK